MQFYDQYGQLMPVPTVRIPELTEQKAEDMSLADFLAGWSATDNKTRKFGLNGLRNLVLNGAGLGTADQPVIAGPSYVLRAGPNHSNQYTMNLPALAGKDFVLRRESFGAIPRNQYDVLNAGGFTLKGGQPPMNGGDGINTGEVFELDVFELAGPLAPDAAGSSALIKGTVIIPTNFPLTVLHMGKLIQLRPQGTPITVVLPDISIVPPNTIVPFEADITTNTQCRLQTSLGQYIYFKNTSMSSVIIGASEQIWFYKGEDGWYVISYSGNFVDVGDIQPRFKVNTTVKNEVELNGQLLSRAQWPRLWEYAQTLGPSLVDETTWNTVITGVWRPAQGCFSTGDGSTTFRVPDFRNMTVRGLKGGADPERALNSPGGMQMDAYQEHDHSMPTDGTPGEDRAGLMASPNADEALSNSNRTGKSGGSTETRMKNIGMLWTIKA